MCASMSTISCAVLLSIFMHSELFVLGPYWSSACLGYSSACYLAALWVSLIGVHCKLNHLDLMSVDLIRSSVRATQ